MPTKPRSPDRIAAITAAVEDCLREGFTPPGQFGGRGSAIREAARRLDVNPTTLLGTVRGEEEKFRCNKPARVPDWSLYAPPDESSRVVGASGHTLKGVSILTDAKGVEMGRWTKTARAGRDDADVQHLPDPKTISKISTLKDQDGKVTQQWVTEKPADAEREALWFAAAAALAAALPPAPPIAGPANQPSADLLALYPVGDHHNGLYAWWRETGASYDLDIAEKLLARATDELIALLPPCETSLIALLGDYFHYDSLEPVTPTSRNMLDSDGRYAKMIDVGMRSVRRMIERAAERHSRVHVIVETGNHDLSSSIFLALALHQIYRDNPRITIDTSPAHFHYFEWGKVLIATHHGHGVKMQNLPLIMAADRREAWGRTKYGYWLTGHVHHAETQSAVVNKDFANVSVESFRVLAPVDAWAAQKGYRSIRDMKAIVMHREFGEVARFSVKPEMFDTGMELAA
jgi:hypothetical protein